jgi:hypothetical protein
MRLVTVQDHRIAQKQAQAISSDQQHDAWIQDDYQTKRWGADLVIALMGVIAGKELLVVVETAIALSVATMPEGLGRVLAGDTAPLVLAGVGYLHTIYRDASSYPHLLDTDILGNPLRPRGVPFRPCGSATMGRL